VKTRSPKSAFNPSCHNAELDKEKYYKQKAAILRENRSVGRDRKWKKIEQTIEDGRETWVGTDLP